MSISILDFGKTDKNETAKLFTVQNKNGVRAVFTNFGATVISIFVPNNKGKLVDVVLGFDTLESYLVNHCYFGATVGRNANRIRKINF